MTNHDDTPRIYVNWERFRPTTWRDWVAIVAFVAVVLAVVALAVVVASTLFAIAIVVGLIAAAALFVNYVLGRLTGGRRRNLRRIDDASD